MDRFKQSIKDKIRESRIAIREGNEYINKNQFISAYRSYQLAEHLLYEAKSFIVDPDEIYTDRTNTSTNKQVTT